MHNHRRIRGRRWAGSLLLLCSVGVSACASANSNAPLLVLRPPQDLLEIARADLVARGYTIADGGPVPIEPGEKRDPIGGDLRAERPIGPDMDTRGYLYEVIRVSAIPDPASGGTRLTVHGGMESQTNMGMRVRVPSTRRVREDAEALRRKLIGE